MRDGFWFIIIPFGLIVALLQTIPGCENDFKSEDQRFEERQWIKRVQSYNSRAGNREAFIPPSLQNAYGVNAYGDYSERVEEKKEDGLNFGIPSGMLVQDNSKYDAAWVARAEEAKANEEIEMKNRIISEKQNERDKKEEILDMERMILKYKIIGKDGQFSWIDDVGVMRCGFTNREDAVMNAAERCGWTKSNFVWRLAESVKTKELEYLIRIQKIEEDRKLEQFSEERRIAAQWQKSKEIKRLSEGGSVHETDGQN